MAPKMRQEMVRPVIRPLDPSLPVELPKETEIEIQTQVRKLIVTRSKVPGTDAYYATLAYPEDRKESCIALCKRPSDAHETFKLLTSCSNKNIAKPLGVWEVDGQNIAYIVFPSIGGALKSIDRKSIFELEDESEPSSSAAFFTDHVPSSITRKLSTNEILDGKTLVDLERWIRKAWPEDFLKMQLWASDPGATL